MGNKAGRPRREGEKLVPVSLRLPESLRPLVSGEGAVLMPEEVREVLRAAVAGKLAKKVARLAPAKDGAPVQQGTQSDEAGAEEESSF